VKSFDAHSNAWRSRLTPSAVRRRRTEVPVHLVHRTWRTCIGNGRAHLLAANNALQTHLAHQTLDGEAGDTDALAVHLPPHFRCAVDAVIVIPDAFDHRLEGGASRCTRGGAVSGRRMRLACS